MWELMVRFMIISYSYIAFVLLGTAVLVGITLFGAYKKEN